MNEIAAAVKQEADKLISNRVYVNEARLIARVYNAAHCERLIDIGCSTGVLAFRIFENIKPSCYIGIDANEFCVASAKALLADFLDIEKQFHCKTIIPCYFESKVVMTGVLGKLVDTSNIYHNYPGAIQFESPNVQVSELLAELDIQPSDFIKIDVDGLDVDIVAELIMANKLPRGLQFEVSKPQIQDVTLNNLFAELAKLGYVLPDIRKLADALFVTICTSTTMGSVIIAKNKNPAAHSGFDMIVESY